MTSYSPLQLFDSNAVHNPGFRVGRPFSPQILHSGRSTPILPSPGSPLRRFRTPDPIKSNNLARNFETQSLGRRTPDPYIKTSHVGDFEDVIFDTFESWLFAAQKSTAEFMTNGSSTPFAWVILLSCQILAAADPVVL